MDFKNMTIEDLVRERELRQSIIALNIDTGIQSDYDRHFMDAETKKFQKELEEINMILNSREDN